MSALSLVRVARDGNPLREHGWAAPFFGKLAPVDVAATDALAARLLDLIEEDGGDDSQEVLVVGLAESSLLLAWWLAHRLASLARAQAVSLALSSRSAPPPGTAVVGDAGASQPPSPAARAPRDGARAGAGAGTGAGTGAQSDFDAQEVEGALASPARSARDSPEPEARESPAPRPVAADGCWLAFREPHSHAPCHFIHLPAKCSAAGPRVLIVEDEITTGVTLTNLVCALNDALRPSRVDVLALLDMRTEGNVEEMQKCFAALGCEAAVHALVDSSASAGKLCVELVAVPPQGLEPPRLVSLPRCEASCSVISERRGPTLQELRATVNETNARCVVAVGECVEAPLLLAAELAAERRAPDVAVRFATRSPWLIDSAAIRSRVSVSGIVGGRERAFYIYNLDFARGQNYVVAALPHEAAIAHAIAALLHSCGCGVHVCDGSA